MREILFRGRRIDNGEWIEGYLFQIWDDAFILWGTTNDVPDMIKVIPETVGQYTGLKDKNGKRIFEGDIVKAVSRDYYGSEFQGVVLFKGGCFGVEYEYLPKISSRKSFHRIGEIGRWQDMGASGTISYTYEVIGNIHDNPELLREG